MPITMHIWCSKPTLACRLITQATHIKASLTSLISSSSKGRKEDKLTSNYHCLRRDFRSLRSLLFVSSRFFAELYEELLVFCFYRQFLIGYMLFIYNISYSNFANRVWSGYDLIHFNTNFFFLSLLPYARKKFLLYRSYRDAANTDAADQIID